MPTASYVKFTPAVENLLEGINAGTDTWAIKLGTAVNASAGTFTEVANGNGYTTGGVTLTISSATQSGGTYTLTFTTPASKAERILKENGMLILRKGPKVEDELNQKTDREISRYDIDLPFQDCVRHLVIIKKKQPQSQG